MRYYADYGNKKAKRKGGDAPNALVIFNENGRYISSGSVCYEGIAAVFEHANSGVAGTGTSLDYLRESCKRISKAEAFRIHPALAARMKETN